MAFFSFPISVNQSMTGIPVTLKFITFNSARRSVFCLQCSLKHHEIGGNNYVKNYNKIFTAK